MNSIIEAIEKEYLKAEVPAFNVGDVVKVGVKVVEGNRERTQAFEGTVIAKPRIVRSRHRKNVPASLAAYRKHNGGPQRQSPQS